MLKQNIRSIFQLRKINVDSFQRYCYRLRRVFALVVAAFLVVQLSGCVTSTKPIGQSVSIGKSRTVFSTIPGQAASAYNQSESDLASANWGVIQKLGPKPGLLDKAAGNNSDSVKSNGKHTTAKATALPFTKLNSTAAQPTTQPSTSSAKAGNSKTKVYMPLTITKLPDNRVQLIWTLRNIGGTSVSASKGRGASRAKVKLRAPNLSYILNVLKSHLGKNGQILPLPAQNALFITCKKKMQASTVQLLNELDQPRIQVHITAKIFETSHDYDYQQGARLLINRIKSGTTQFITGNFDTQNLLNSLASGGPYQGSVVGMTQKLVQAGIDIQASLQLLAKTGLISIVAAPRMTVATGQTGYMLAGKELPIQSSSISDSTIKFSTKYKPVGVQLYISPEAAGPNTVKLHLIAVVSSVQGFSPLPTLLTSGSPTTLVNPVIKTREAETTVTIKPGSTLVISGMKMIRNIARQNKIPILGDIPLLGIFFKNKRTQKRMTDLYFFITPTLASASTTGLY